MYRLFQPDEVGAVMEVKERVIRELMGAWEYRRMYRMWPGEALFSRHRFFYQQ